MSVSEQIVISCDSQSCDQAVVLQGEPAADTTRKEWIDQALTEHAWTKIRYSAAGVPRRHVDHFQIHSREMRLLLGDNASDNPLANAELEQAGA